MAEAQSAKSKMRYGDRKSINLYRQDTLLLWEDATAAVREEFDTEDATQGEIAAEAFAQYLGRKGPLSEQ